MNIPPDRLILLDTSVIVHLARNSDTGKGIEMKYGLSLRRERPLISSVSKGEILSLAMCWGWGPKKMEVLEGLLSELVPVDAGRPEIVQQYATLYCFCRKQGHPCGENDLWIAATAKAINAVLFTCDKDFDALTGQIVHVFIPQQ